MTTEERFDALEKTLETSVRRQRITITALILVAVAAVVMAAAPQSRDATFDKITAKKLFIVNDAGKVQATLGVGENGGALSINNKTGERVVQLKADENGNGLVGAYNRKGKGRTLQPW